jgi:hypothetical protein
MVFFATTNPYKKGDEAQSNFLKIWCFIFVKVHGNLWKYLVTESSVVQQCLHVVFLYNFILVEEMLLAMVIKTMKLHVWSHLVSIATM